MSTPDVELLQFPYSHFNEKARWALDWKGVPHVRTNLLPGPHAPRIKRITGRTEVPVLRLGTEFVDGSARILDALERLHPDPPLYPADPVERRRALTVQHHFDEEFGPRIRQALFSEMFHEPGYVCRMFAEPHPWPVRALYRATFPIGKQMIRRAYRFDDPAEVKRAFDQTGEALDFVAKEAGPDGHLVGNAFSVADLTAAALLAPTVDPPDCTMTRPRPIPARVQEWLARWERHPGAAWVLETYRRFRAPAAAKGGRSST